MLQVMLIYSSIKPSTVTSYKANLPFCSLLYFRWEQGKLAASQPRAAFAPRLVLLGHTHCHRHLCPELKAASKGMSHSQAPKNHPGDRRAPQPVPSPSPLLRVSPACPAQHLPLPPLSIPFKLILLCRAQAKTYSQRPISVVKTQRGAVNREHNDLCSVRVEAYTRAKYYHS